MHTVEQNLVDRLNRPLLKPMKIVVRPGSQDILQYPSRMGNNLYYPNGRIVKDAPSR